MTLIHVFPGQGSQRVGMGREVFARFPHLVTQAEKQLGWSLRDLCENGPSEKLSNTRYTQPAIYVVSALNYLALVRDSGEIPTLLAGHSLGEYTALFAGGAYDFFTGLEIVSERGRLMSEAPAGSMAAVIGLDKGKVSDVLNQRMGQAGVELVNLNLIDQVVIAGAPEALEEAVPTLKEAGAATVARLSVSGAFHSSLMSEPAKIFRKFLAGYRFNKLRISTLSDITAAPHEQATLHELLSRQMTEPVNWTGCMDHMLRQPDPEIVDVGPGRVLAQLVAKHRAASGSLEAQGARR
ncbi:ACP S-malonyltransferase [Actinomyces bowdenii]|uniref:Malonyl CoA-acyl carrier protein transacylase n=1 Tax=Actinomyces bowdenii TaxID=131109 RepID=A0A853EJM3_9ACTO|nr:ACP S-malonyltransferase [Actinomyces bowdenii]MBF0695873.1 ACP S-malonyltransferase [Actinomyces bowdenii]MDO5092618.1 ACP S-malonyltransferase [Propionibacteriaceae bacterium]NYS68046.1 ACP S-malonyltransferase [Actinomyces bowdenii]